MKILFSILITLIFLRLPIVIITIIILKSIENQKIIYHRRNITRYNRRNIYINEYKDYVPYIRKNLLTKNEWTFYKELKPIADKMNYTILCKTRIADLVEVESGLTKSEWQTAFNKINKKHIDFILSNPDNLYPILLIELDDSSHEQEKVKARDEFVERIYQKTGYKLLRVKNNNELENKITEALSNT